MLLVRLFDLRLFGFVCFLLLLVPGKAAVCVGLTLCCFVVYSSRRFVVCLSVCHFVLVFFSPFSIAITSLGEERAQWFSYVCSICACLDCRFPLPLGVWEGLRFVIVALPGLFSYIFCDCGTPWTFLLPFLM